MLLCKLSRHCSYCNTVTIRPSPSAADLSQPGQHALRQELERSAIAFARLFTFSFRYTR